MYAIVDGVVYETENEANAAMDHLDLVGEYYTLQYPDGALWECGPQGYMVKLNNA